jgi:hypothetical protein
MTPCTKNTSQLRQSCKLLLLFIAVASCQTKPTQYEGAEKRDYLKEYLSIVHQLNYDQVDNVLIINNLVCSSCSGQSLNELKESDEYINFAKKLIVLAKRDSSYQSKVFSNCNNCQFVYDNGTLSKYGLLKSYPHWYKIQDGKKDSIIIFYGKNR